MAPEISARLRLTWRASACGFVGHNSARCVAGAFEFGYATNLPYGSFVVVVVVVSFL
jgi:hypothetical protein